MKPRFTNQKSRALTLIEVLLVILILAVLVAMFLPVYSASHRRADRVECISNLRQVGMAYQFWERDHSTSASVTNDDRLNVTNAESGWNDFLSMANTLGSTKIFHCPADTNHDGKISYFFNLSARAC